MPTARILPSHEPLPRASECGGDYQTCHERLVETRHLLFAPFAPNGAKECSRG